jgi:hypothetical protein
MQIFGFSLQKMTQGMTFAVSQEVLIGRGGHGMPGPHGYPKAVAVVEDDGRFEKCGNSTYGEPGYDNVDIFGRLWVIFGRMVRHRALN